MLLSLPTCSPLPILFALNRRGTWDACALVQLAPGAIYASARLFRVVGRVRFRKRPISVVGMSWVGDVTRCFREPIARRRFRGLDGSLTVKIES